MKLSTHNARRPINATLVSLAVAAIVAPQSQAKYIDAYVYRLTGQQTHSVPLVTDHSGTQSPIGNATVYRLLHQQAESVPLVTDHSGRAGVEARFLVGSARVYRLVNPQAQSVPLVTDHAGRASESSIGLSTASANGFDWRDAGIGAAGALGLVALGAATVAGVRRRSALA
jgi:hypothetical protein